MPDGGSFVFVRALPEEEAATLSLHAGDRRGRAVDAYHARRFDPGRFTRWDSHRAVGELADPDPAAHVDFAKAGFNPTAEQKKSDIHTIDQLFFQGNGQGYTYQDHPHIWIVDADGANPQAADFGAMGRRLRRVVARRQDDSLRFVALRERRQRCERRLPRSRPPAARRRNSRRRFPPTTACFSTTTERGSTRFAAACAIRRRCPRSFRRQLDGSDARTSWPQRSASPGATRCSPI